MISNDNPKSSTFLRLISQNFSKILKASIVIVIGAIVSSIFSRQFSNHCPSVALPPLWDRSICWVDYSPTNYNPTEKIFPSEESIREDLTTLQNKGFTGLVTYGTTDILGIAVPRIAKDLGFSAMIIGIWDPNNNSEIKLAIKAADDFPELIKGFVVGNEGLEEHRYVFDELNNVMNKLREKTCKPVATSEDSKYYDRNPKLLGAGDWVFPTTHPYWSGYTDPPGAIQWTKTKYEQLSRAGKPVCLKEVGFPTSGDSYNRLNEEIQTEFYVKLQDTKLPFIYFEAFDQPWKKRTSFESSWGLFKKNREPKKIVDYICGKKMPVPQFQTIKPILSTFSPQTAAFFHVYTDVEASTNFFPTGKMGDIGDITVNMAYKVKPFSGNTCIMINYRPEGKAPHTCDYEPPCKFAGIQWQNPANNWGTIPDVGYNLTGYKRLSFMARSDSKVICKFSIGGIASGPYPDSLKTGRSAIEELNSQWKKLNIDLVGADLSYVIGGFNICIGWMDNELIKSSSMNINIYRDNIGFERE